MAPVRTEAERALMARGAALLFGGGGALVFITLALPRADDLDVLIVALPPSLALFVCGFLAWADERVPEWALFAIVVVGSLLVTMCVSGGGEQGAAYAYMYVWVAMYAGAFFPAGWAVAQLGVIAAAFPVGLALNDAISQPSVRWAMAIGVSAVAGILMRLVAVRVRQLAADLRAVAAAASLDVEESLTAACSGLRDSAAADVVVLFAEDGGQSGLSGLSVMALAGSRDAAMELSGRAPRMAIEKAYRSGERTDLKAAAPGVWGTIGGFAQPMLRDERVVGVLVAHWRKPRHRVTPRLCVAGDLFAGEASTALDRLDRRSAERERRILDINDNIVQGLVITKYALQLGRIDSARQTLDETLERARNIVTGKLQEIGTRPGKILPGDLVRIHPGPVLGPEESEES